MTRSPSRGARRSDSTASWSSTSGSGRRRSARRPTRYDVVSARTETYERPGALPTVTLGATIEQDLARRDFTVNAMAVGLDGREVAWPGAREDLDGGVLRVLHDRSFIDDPTRMLRLVRYQHRLGFAPDPHTAALIDHDLLSTVSQDRINREIRLLLAESPHLLAEYGALSDVPEIVAAIKLHTRTDVPDVDLWRLLRRERPETIELLVAAGDEGRSPLAGRGERAPA